MFLAMVEPEEGWDIFSPLMVFSKYYVEFLSLIGADILFQIASFSSSIIFLSVFTVQVL
jgi:hypothetical protein